MKTYTLKEFAQALQKDSDGPGLEARLDELAKQREVKDEKEKAPTAD